MLAPGNPASAVENSYAAGDVNAPDTGSSGGLVGTLNDSSILHSFYTDDTFGEGPAKGEAITPSQLEDISTFTDKGWDFTGTWTMSAENGRPALQWETL